MSGKRGKNDAADAAAICEAVTRPTMRFVPVKDIDPPVAPTLTDSWFFYFANTRQVHLVGLWPW